MYGIKIWSSENKNDWYLLRDMDDGVVHVWDKKEDARKLDGKPGAKKQRKPENGAAQTHSFHARR